MKSVYRAFAVVMGLVLFSGIMAGSPAAKQSVDIKAQLRAVAEKAKQKNKISAVSLAVMLPQQNKPVLINLGTTQRNNKQAVSADSLYQVGSLTKTFTAALVMNAVAKGQLRLDDALGKWLPTYKKWRRITINQLINQTSGLPDYHLSKGWWDRLYKNPNKVWAPEELMKTAYALPVNFKAGQAWAYSNTNYVLLGMVVAKAAKQPTATLMRALFARHHLKHTYYLPHVYPKSIMTQMVHGYRQDKDQTSMNGSWLQAAGTLVSNPADIVRWAQYDMQMPRYFVSTDTGKRSRSLQDTAYGFGVFHFNTPQGLLYFTPGLTPGYVSVMGYAPCAGAYFAYSAARAPMHYFHKEMMLGLMKVLNQYSIKKGFKAPSYCEHLKPAARFTFPKI